MWLSREIRTSQISKAVKTKSLVDTAMFFFFFFLSFFVLFVCLFVCLFLFFVFVLFVFVFVFVCFVFLSDCYDIIQQGHRPHHTSKKKTSNKIQAGSKLHSHSHRLPVEATFHTEKYKVDV